MMAKAPKYPQLLKAEITAKHLDGAFVTSNDDCPMARMLEERYPGMAIEVRRNYIRVGRRYYFQDCEWVREGWLRGKPFFITLCLLPGRPVDWAR